MRILYQEVPELFEKKMSASRLSELKALMIGKICGFEWGLARHWGKEAWIDEGLRVYENEREYKYAYLDDDYEAVVVRTVEEYKKKCNEMFMDYCKYLDFIMAGQMCFVFVVDGKQHNKTVAAIEMVGDSIIDVYGRCNLGVDEKLYKWVEHYAEEKGLNYRRFENEDDLPLPFD